MHQDQDNINFPTQFAIAIVAPGAGTTEVVSAAIKHNVHIIDKESYDHEKNYIQYQSYLQTAINSSILLLMVFANGNSSIIANAEELSEAINALQAVSN